MKRQVFLFCLAAMLSQQVSAQGFFKKLGKALTESAKEIVSGGAVTQQTKWGNVTIKHQIPNLTVSLQNVERNGNSAIVTLLFTNTSSTQSKVYGLYHQKTFDSQGNEYNARCQVGRNLLVLGDAWNSFEPNVPTKVFYIINNVPSKAFSLRLLKFESQFYRNGQGAAIDAPIEVRNITVPEMVVNTQTVSNTQITKTQTVNKLATNTNMGVFKGVWQKVSGDNERGIELFGSGKKSENYENRTIYGSISAVLNEGRWMNDGEITKISVNGNTAEIEFICDKAEETETGKAKLVYNPTTKIITFTIIKAPDMCLWQDITNYVMKKVK